MDGISPLDNFCRCTDIARQEEKLEVIPSAGVYLFRVNTEQSPFNHVKIRQAFALALNRADLVEFVLQGNQEPAFGLIPYSFISSSPYFDDYNIKLAHRFFPRAVVERENSHWKIFLKSPSIMPLMKEPTKLLKSLNNNGKMLLEFKSHFKAMSPRSTTTSLRITVIN